MSDMSMGLDKTKKNDMHWPHKVVYVGIWLKEASIALHNHMFE